MSVGPFERFTQSQEFREVMRWRDDAQEKEISALRRSVARWKEGSGMAQVAQSDGYLHALEDFEAWVTSRIVAERKALSPTPELTNA